MRTQRQVVSTAALMICLVGCLWLWCGPATAQTVFSGEPSTNDSVQDNVETDSVEVDVSLEVAQTGNTLRVRFSMDAQTRATLASARTRTNRSLTEHLLTTFVPGSLAVFANVSLSESQHSHSTPTERQITLTLSDFQLNDAPGYRATVANRSLSVFVQDGVSPSVHPAIKSVTYRIYMPTQITATTADAVAGRVAVWNIHTKQPRLVVRSASVSTPSDPTANSSAETGTERAGSGIISDGVSPPTPNGSSSQDNAETDADTDTIPSWMRGWVVIIGVGLVCIAAWMWTVRRRKIRAEQAEE